MAVAYNPFPALAVSTALVVTLSCPAPTSAERLFVTPYFTLEAGPNSSHVALVDINGDEAPDVVYSGSEHDSYGEGHSYIASFMGPPRGTTYDRGPFARFEDGVQAPVMAAGDLSGDGTQDIVAIVWQTHSAALLWVGLGRAGLGGLTDHVSYPIVGRPLSLTIGDVNGDGRADVVVTKHYTGLSIFFGSGDGTLAPGAELDVGPYPLGVALGDLDGDARMDMVVGFETGNVATFLGDGHGAFQLHATQTAVSGGGPVGLADFNADGRLDLTVGGGLLLGNGDGGFGPKLSHGAVGPFAVGDFNGDGMRDLTITSSEGLVVLSGRGDGTFEKHVVCDIWGNDVAVGDLNQDGYLDISVANGRIAVFHGNGDGAFGRVVPSYPVGPWPIAIATGDLDGDGRADAAVANHWSNTVSLLYGKGDGTFESRRDLVTGGAPSALVLEDFDRDGNLDLVVAEQVPRTVSVLGGHGDGTFDTPVAYPFTTGVPSSLAVGDFDEDGFSDLAVADGTRTVSVQFGGGAGPRLGGRLSVTFPWAGYKLAIADVTGDGHLDIVLQGSEVAFIPGRGDGTFAEQEGDGERVPEYGHYYSLATIDLCNNCTHQVLAASSCCPTLHGGNEHRLEAPFGTRCRGKSEGVTPPASPAMVVGDLDGDGLDDLAMPGSIALGNGGGGFGSQQDFGIERGAGDGMAIEDLNGDGRGDLLLTKATADRIQVLLNQGARAAIPAPPKRVTVRPADAALELSWDAVQHPNLAGYRVYYDLKGNGGALAGTGAAEGPSPLAVPADGVTLTMHCLRDSTYSVKVTAMDREGRESRCVQAVSAHPRPVGGEFTFTYGGPNGASHGRWVMGLLQLDGGLSAADVVPGTVTLNGVGPGEPLGVTDRDHDGRQELKLRFPRSAVEAAPPGRAGNLVEGLVTGCPDTLRFAVDDGVSIRRRGPSIRPMALVDADAVEATPGEAHDLVRVVAGRPTVSLHPVPPTPAPQGCTIAFDLPEAATVRVHVFDLHGRMVGSVLDGAIPAGAHRVWWNRSAVPDGIYFLRMEAGSFKTVRRIILLH